MMIKPPKPSILTLAPFADLLMEIAAQPSALAQAVPLASSVFFSPLLIWGLLNIQG